MLAKLPIQYIKPSSSGWTMQFSRQTNALEIGHGPGVYGTAFAIRLLSKSEQFLSGNYVAAAIRGLDHVFSELRVGSSPSERQLRKREQVGHHDVELTLKNVAALEAIAAVARHRNHSTACSEAVALYRRRTESIIEILLGHCRPRHRLINEMGWSWLAAPPDQDAPEVAVLPTAITALALSDPDLPCNEAFRGSARAVGDYLLTEIECGELLAFRAWAFLAWNSLQTHYGIDSSRRERIIDSFRKILTQELNTVHHYPLQELVQYHIPASLGGGHYRPSIWFSPRLIILRALMILSGERARKVSLTTAFEVIDLSKEDGGVQFLKGQAPTLVANFDAVSFLGAVENRYLRSRSDQFWASLALLNRETTRLLFEVPAALWIASLTGISFIAARLGSHLTTAPAAVTSWTVATASLDKLLSIWPIWIIWLLFCLLLGERPFRQRIARFFVVFLPALFLDIVVEVVSR